MLIEYLVENRKTLVIYLEEEFRNGMCSIPVGVTVLQYVVALCVHLESSIRKGI